MNPPDNQVSATVQTGALPGTDVIGYDAELVLNAIPGGVYATDLEGRATLVNDGASRLLGWTGADLIGRVLHEVIHHTRPDGSAYPLDECPLYHTLRDGETRRSRARRVLAKRRHQHPDRVLTAIRSGETVCSSGRW